MRTGRRLARRVAVAVILAAATLAAIPAAAAAHGPVDPVATKYLARLTHVPAGLDARVVDGYVRMWLSVPPSETVVVLDYRGAPYLRFSRRGVQVNQNSTMYFLSQTPVATTPASDLNASKPPAWREVSDGHVYEWRDERLQALSTVAIPPGASYVGRWRIPLLLNGRAAAIAGGLWHADNPSIVWFWPILVLLGCVVAACRLRRLDLDARVARMLATAALIAVGLAGLARELHGRPSVSTGQWLQLLLVAGFVGWGLRHVLLGNPGYFGYFVIGSAALWEGFNLLPSLINGYVLLALPAFVVRVAAVLCIGSGLGIFWPAFRLAESPRRRPGPGAGTSGLVEVGAGR